MNILKNNILTQSYFTEQFLPNNEHENPNF
jgi:hypothetical protein